MYQLIDPDLGPVFTKEPLDGTDLACSFYFPGLDLLTANKFNPDQPRDSKGRWMPAGMAKGTGRTPSAAGQSAMVHAALGKKADVSSHVEAINTLRSRGTDLSKEEITAHVNRLGRHLNKAQVHDVARATGVAVAKTKKDTLAAIHQHLQGSSQPAHEMTRLEFAKRAREQEAQAEGRRVPSTPTGLEADVARLWGSGHESMVREALAQGKHVPAHVLAEYPHLTGSPVGTTTPTPPEPHPVARAGQATLKHEVVKVAPIDSWSGARWRVGDKEFLSAKDAKAHVTSLKSTADDARGIAQKSREFARQIGRDQQKRGDPLWDGRARDAVTHAERLESLAKATAQAKTTQDVQRIRDAVDGPLRHMVSKGSPADQEQINLVAKLTGIHQHLQGSSKKQVGESKEISQGHKVEVGQRLHGTYTVPGEGTYHISGEVTHHRFESALQGQSAYGQARLKLDSPAGSREALLLTTDTSGRIADERFGGGPHPAATGKDSRQGATSADFATKVVEAAKGLPNTFGHGRDPGSEKWMGHKVYVSDLYDHLKPTLGGMGLKDFKQKLLEAHLGGKLTLLRDDLGGTRSHEAGAKHGASEIQHLNATFHTVDAHGKSAAATPTAQPEPHQALAKAVGVTGEEAARHGAVRTEGGNGPGEWQTAYFKDKKSAAAYADGGIRSTQPSKSDNGLWVVRAQFRPSRVEEAAPQHRTELTSEDVALEPHASLAKAVAGKQGFTGPFQRGPHTVVRHDDSGHTIEAEAGNHSGRFAVKDPSNVVHSRHDTAEAAVAAIHGVNRIGTSQGTVDKELRDRAAQAGAGATATEGVGHAEAARRLGLSRSLATYEDTSRPLGERLNRLADIDTSVMDHVYNAGLLTDVGVRRNNEFLRTVYNGYREWEQGLKSSGDRERLATRLDRVEADIRLAAAGMRKWDAEGKTVKDPFGRKVDLNAAATLYEGPGLHAVAEVRRAAGLPRASKRVGSSK